MTTKLFRPPRTIPTLFECLVCLALTVWQLNAAGQEHDHPVPEKLGIVKFPNSCSASSQQDFERAVALLHSFAYSAAENAFRDLISKDPNCAMAYWGVAMTCFHQLWEPYVAPQDLERGRAAIEQAKRIGGSERERGFTDALNLIYANAETVPYSERAKAYTLAMAKLAQSNPDDVECQIFYALALIATASPADKTHANDKKAADLLERLFRKHPQHPGIPHYLIHACDNSEMARRGAAAAEAYSKIAPSAPHALHMPSHIYTRLGLWKESVASNAAARKAAHVQGDIGEELHAMDYLTYAYLQLGRDAEAARVLDDLHAMSGLQAAEFKIGYAASAMPVRYALERKQWREVARLDPIPGTQPHVFAITIWARALGLARSGDPAGARSEVDQLKAAYEKVRAAGDDYWATQVHVQLNEALAWIAHAEGKKDEAIKLMQDAADEEDAVDKRPVTPGAIIPAREQLGDLLLELNRPQEALAEFERALTMTPQRRGALAGKARALEMVGAAQGAKT
jgi:tetratricopeptide (TPR) repeat protein